MGRLSKAQKRAESLPAEGKLCAPGTETWPTRWQPRTGDTVELRQRGRTFRIGQVEVVMPDGSGFWLAADGADPRLYVPAGGEPEIWIRG